MSSETAEAPQGPGDTPEPTRRQRSLQAYHDGELRGPARWRFERALRRDPALRRELAALEALAERVREILPGPPEADLWDAIALRLPAADARRSEPEEGRLGRLGWPGAAAATTALAAVLVASWLASGRGDSGEVVRWIDSGGRDVMVLEGAPDTTIIWVIEDPKKDGARRGGGRDRV